MYDLWSQIIQTICVEAHIDSRVTSMVEVMDEREDTFKPSDQKLEVGPAWER